MKCMEMLFTLSNLLNLLIIVLTFSCEAARNESKAQFYPVKSFVYDVTKNESECNDSTNICVRKCCDLNYILNNETCVYSNSTELNQLIYKNVNLTVNESDLFDIHFLPGIVECTSGERQKYDFFLNKSFVIFNDGTLWITNISEYFYDDTYCIDYDEDNGALAFVCSWEFYSVSDWSYKLKFLGILISLPFLFITFVVYALLPERNFHGTCLMCYVFSYFTASFLVVLFVFYRIGECRTGAMVFFFSFLASFCWMNLMCFDIWSTFSGFRGFSKNTKRNTRKRFLFYNIYAWGVPLLLIILVGIIRHNVDPKAWYHPGVEDEVCFLGYGIPELLYFYLPFAMLIMANVIFFVMTAWNIKQVQKDTSTIAKTKNGKVSYENNKQRFKLYIKLMLAMGITWSMEVIERVVKWTTGGVPPAVWYLSDFCNAAFGVFIFLVFVFKKSTWKLLKRRYYMTIEKLRQTKMTPPSVDATSLSSLRTQNLQTECSGKCNN